MQERPTGLAESTLVHGPQGKRPVEELVGGDQIWSHDCELGEWLVTNVRRLVSKRVKTDLARLQIGGGCLALASAHLVWAQSPAGAPSSWAEAKNLAPGDRVLSTSGPLLVDRNDLVEGEEVTLVELETAAPHSFAAGPLGILVHNRIPALADGQAHNINVPATGAHVPFTLPPIEMNHLVCGFFRHGTTVLEGLHCLPVTPAIQQGVTITIANHTVMTTDAAGGQIPRVVELRVTPWLATTGDAPFSARVEIFDPATKGRLAYKTNSTFFPVNWTQHQVIQAIYEAATNYVQGKGYLPVGSGMWADTDAGVSMKLHTRAPGGVPDLITTSYPNGPQPAVTAADAPQ